MYQVARERRVWWPVDLVGYDETGTERTTTVRFLFELMPRKEQQAREQEILKRLRELAEQKAAEQEAENRRRAEEGDPGINLPARVAEQQAEMERALRERAQTEESEIELVVARTHDWRGFEDSETKEALAFDRAALASLMDYEDFRLAVCRGYADACRGAVRKNSSPGPGGKPGRAQSTRG